MLLVAYLVAFLSTSAIDILYTFTNTPVMAKHERLAMAQTVRWPKDATCCISLQPCIIYQTVRKLDSVSDGHPLSKKGDKGSVNIVHHKLAFDIESCTCWASTIWIVLAEKEWWIKLSTYGEEAQYIQSNEPTSETSRCSRFLCYIHQVWLIPISYSCVYLRVLEQGYERKSEDQLCLRNALFSST